MQNVYQTGIGFDGIVDNRTETARVIVESNFLSVSIQTDVLVALTIVAAIGITVGDVDYTNGTRSESIRHCVHNG